MKIDTIDKFYEPYIGAPEPKRLKYECGWVGNKPKTIKFKKAPEKKCCPYCGGKTFENADYTFWRTANKNS